MIDFHNHVLPNVDDGSKSLEMSILMLRTASEQGITDVVNTVHFQHPKVELENINFDRIKTEIRKLQNEIDRQGIPIDIHIGSEVFYLPNLLKIKDNPLVTIGNGNYMLIEFHPHQIPETQKQQLYELKLSGITPIIAHPERYRQVQDNIDLVAEWLEAGCIIQIDAGSPIGLLGNRAMKASQKIIRNKWCQLVGSDAHDNKNRKFCLSESLKFINNFLGDDMIEWVTTNPRKILNGEKIQVEIEYESKNSDGFISVIKHRLGLI
tara:strand:+ start:15 stop:809 length:795 start_codon:yes stop_codon:yes gene_type:complete